MPRISKKNTSSSCELAKSRLNLKRPPQRPLKNEFGDSVEPGAIENLVWHWAFFYPGIGPETRRSRLAKKSPLPPRPRGEMLEPTPSTTIARSKHPILRQTVTGRPSF